MILLNWDQNPPYMIFKGYCLWKHSWTIKCYTWLIVFTSNDIFNGCIPCFIVFVFEFKHDLCNFNTIRAQNVVVCVSMHMDRVHYYVVTVSHNRPKKFICSDEEVQNNRILDHKVLLSCYSNYLENLLVSTLCEMK